MASLVIQSGKCKNDTLPSQATISLLKDCDPVVFAMTVESTTGFLAEGLGSENRETKMEIGLNKFRLDKVFYNTEKEKDRSAILL